LWMQYRGLRGGHVRAAVMAGGAAVPHLRHRRVGSVVEGTGWYSFDSWPSMTTSGAAGCVARAPGVCARTSVAAKHATPIRPAVKIAIPLLTRPPGQDGVRGSADTSPSTGRPAAAPPPVRSKP